MAMSNLDMSGSDPDMARADMSGTRPLRTRQEKTVCLVGRA
jgi:hypothetical protein